MLRAAIAARREALDEILTRYAATNPRLCGSVRARSDAERFADIIDAIDRCQQYAPYLTRERIPDVPWAAIAGLRNVVVHEYFRMNPELVLDIVDSQVRPLKEKLQRSERSWRHTRPAPHPLPIARALRGSGPVRSRHAVNR
jgi:uncharacterized protein with HEPN domain